MKIIRVPRHSNMLLFHRIIRDCPVRTHFLRIIYPRNPKAFPMIFICVEHTIVNINI